MQLAINVVIFFLGLYLPTLVASKPRKAREDLSRNVTRQIQKIISAICGRGQPEEGVDVEQEPESIEDGAARLYTKEQVESEFDMNAWQRLA
ncbi:hypothetical protein CLAFUR4_20110 [Fulvia fulva]|nr:hypothetical protein CLAFUR4_20110 [Fulvia fulva]KAK4609524.1 hypothetical protein CLAFUR0_20110 [Fulvia fulva]WPV37684.1 hypothetical protein CLAFUW7_20110 [Fulvia fulva]